jgi:phosphatidylserine/phosphatidylglycerophosphate/cardiolipin synthase-like enzyme
MSARIVRLVTRDVPGYFFQRVMATGLLTRLTLVSPWVDLAAGTAVTLRAVLERAVGRGTRIYLVTRPPALDNPHHLAAVSLAGVLARSRVYLHPQLHAKFFIAEGPIGSFAVLGSANLTVAGSSGREVGVYIVGRSWGEDLIRDLVVLGQRLRHDPGVRRWRDEV